MKHWFQQKWKSDYVQRQVYMMSNLGLFYIILIALFGIPLIGAFVVVLIKGVLDFQYLILGVGIVAGGLFVYFTGRFLVRFFRKVRQDGFSAIHDARDQAGRGVPVQLDFMGGLLSLSYGGEPAGRRIEGSATPPLLAGPDADPIGRLKELRDLKTEGVIDQEEFDLLKKTLIDGLRHASNDPAAD